MIVHVLSAIVVFALCVGCYTVGLIRGREDVFQALGKAIDKRNAEGEQ